jgi:hypothetical protein
MRSEATRWKSANKPLRCGAERGAAVCRVVAQGGALRGDAMGKLIKQTVGLCGDAPSCDALWCAAERCGEIQVIQTEPLRCAAGRRDAVRREARRGAS